MASRIQGITVEIGGDTTKLSSALSGINKEIKGTQTQLKDVEKLLKLDPSNTELVAQKQKLLAQEIGATKEKLTTLKTAAEQANEQLQKGEITQEQYDALQREIQETEQKLKSLETQAATTNSTLAKIEEIGGKMQTVGDSISGVGKKLMPLSAAVTAIGTAAVKTTADFDSQMSTVKSIYGATGEEFDALRDKALEMGSKTSFSATEAGQAMEYMALAGWNTSEMVDGISGIMDAAAASGENLATTSDIITDGLTAFGLSAKDSAHFADVLVKTGNSANTTVSMMGETFKYAGAVCGSLGISIEDAAIATGLMGNAGIKASNAGAALRTGLTNLVKPTDQMAAAMDKYGVAIQTNSEGNVDLYATMQNIRTALGDLDKTEQAAAISAIFGKNAMSGWSAIVNASEDDFNSLTEAIYDADGAAKEAADIKLDNLSGQITILKSTIEGIAIQISDILMPTVRAIVAKIQEWATAFSNLDTETKETIVKIGAVVTAIGPLLVILGTVISKTGAALKGFSSLAKGVSALASKVGSASGLFGKLGAALGGISAPVVAAVAVIGTLVAAFMNLWNTNEEFRTAITEIWNGIKATFSAFAQEITAKLNSLGFDFQSITDVIKAVWNGFCEALAPVFTGAFQLISNTLSVVLNTLSGLLSVFIGVFTGDWQGAWDGGKQIFSGAWEFIKNTLSTVLGTLQGVVNVFLGWFGTDWHTIWGGIKTFFEGVWNGIASFFSGVLSCIQSVATMVWTAVSGFFTTVLTGIQTTFTTIWNAISGAVSTVMAAIQTTISTVWTAISTAVSTVLNTIQTAVTTVWNAISTAISTVMTNDYDPDYNYHGLERHLHYD